MMHFENLSIIDIEDEKWEDVPSFEGKYKISNMGRIKVVKRNIILKQHLDSRKLYLLCGLWKNNKLTNRLVHRIVGELFVPNPFNLPQINHKFGNKLDNRAIVLEWTTASDNHKHRIHVLGQKYPSRKGIYNLTAKTTLQLSLDGDFIKEWPSAKEIQRQLGFAASNINACCVGSIKSSKGYIWRYKE